MARQMHNDSTEILGGTMDRELKENSEILLYSLDDSNVYVDVYFEDENF